jgi:hypothetical protein
MAKVQTLERVRYFPRQLMTAEDMRAEQEYFLERMRRHNRLFHGWGILCGLDVQAAATSDKPWQVRICPGDACSPMGDEVHVAAPVLLDLAQVPGAGGDDCVPCPCPPETPMSGGAPAVSVSYLAVRYLCRPSRPVRTGAADCGCADNGCETSRFRDDFELALLTDLPVPYDAASVTAEQTWLSKLAAGLSGGGGAGGGDVAVAEGAPPRFIAAALTGGGVASLFGLPTPTCPPATVGPWVILATVTGDLTTPPPLPVKSPPSTTAPTAADLNAALQRTLAFDKRRLLPRVQDLLGI